MPALARRFCFVALGLTVAGFSTTAAWAQPQSSPPPPTTLQVPPTPVAPARKGPPLPLKMFVTPVFGASTAISQTALRELVDEINSALARGGRSFVPSVNEADSEMVLEITNGTVVPPTGRGALPSRYKIDAQVRILDLYDGAVSFTVDGPVAGVGTAPSVAATPAPSIGRPPGRWIQGATSILEDLGSFCTKHADEIDKRRGEIAEYNARDLGVDIATVAVKSTDLRQKADAASPLVKTLERGTEAVLITRSKSNAWLNVVLPDTLDEGWIRDDAVRLRLTEKPRAELFTPTKTEVSTAPPILKVFNDTDREITLSIAGTRYTVPSQTKQDITVQAGTYTVFCSAARVLPYTGTETWAQGYEYSVRYYIGKK